MKTSFIVFDFIRAGVELKSIVSVADAHFTEPLIYCLDLFLFSEKLETWQIVALIFGTVFVVIVVIAQIRFWGSKMKQKKIKQNDEEKTMKDSNREIFA